ncbi:hypothetical protein C1H46_006477 [Malus baccata]|uniref:Uncharacterized protein n=1 Tax=Malus baccata TaxID=106549 RepID=A0A540NA73_MALBA|nr:hypothetical protein C1H46_006477 [Malus baccata]
MVQFLLLMVALDKLYYSPLGKFMDERDSTIREMPTTRCSTPPTTRTQKDRTIRGFLELRIREKEEVSDLEVGSGGEKGCCAVRCRRPPS